MPRTRVVRGVAVDRRLDATRASRRNLRRSQGLRGTIRTGQTKLRELPRSIALRMTVEYGSIDSAVGRLFISYRHENAAHGEAVRFLAESIQKVLFGTGVEVVLDQFLLKGKAGGPDEGWPRWCSLQVAEADRVLIIASRGWSDVFSRDGDSERGCRSRVRSPHDLAGTLPVTLEIEQVSSVFAG